MSKGRPVLADIAARGELLVGTAAIMPPLSMKSKSGAIIGLEADMARSMGEAMGVKTRFVVMPFADLLPALETGKVDMIISGMTMTPARNMKVAFVGPYFVSGKGILTKTDNLLAKDPSKLNSPQTRIAVLAGSTSEELVKKELSQASVIPTPDYDTAINMVLNDQVGALVADYPICVVALLRHPGKNLLAVLSPLSYEPLGIALPASDPLLLNWVDNYLAYLAGSGMLDNMQEYWLNDPSWLAELP
ncbi:MAG: transporter substrate-binding domain-containing protein [Deltaproteobacteria bacterium]|nr:transporter substrate-binding domain-containing protein [Deltaproteobacteria bacterium]